MDDFQNLSEDFSRDFNILKTNVQNDIDELREKGELTSENRWEIYEFHNQVFREKMFVKIKANMSKHVDGEYQLRVLYELEMLSDELLECRRKFQEEGQYSDADMLNIDYSNMVTRDMRKLVEWEMITSTPEELIEIRKKDEEFRKLHFSGKGF